MASISIDLNMKRTTNPDFVAKAVACAPKLREKVVKPTALVEIQPDEAGIAQIASTRPISELSTIAMKKGDRICLDFGHHQVGYVRLKLKSVGSPQDAPAFLKLKFGEVAKEILDKSEDYHGWISRGWIQEEFVHIDVLPAYLELPRRYAFRFLEIETIDTSLKWQLVVESAAVTAVSAVDMDTVEPYSTEDALLQKIDDASLRTLQNCMQDVFEDGPKRDRRLWLGDLRLQALANYATYKNYDLVKRCLYLFGGLTRDDGKIGACLFTEPEYIVDDTFFFDYSLFFVSALYDYYMETRDLDTLKDLWEIAYRQIEIARESIDADHLVKIVGDFTCFIDWTEGLNKDSSAQGVYIYVLRQAEALARILGNPLADSLQEEITEMVSAIKKYRWDEETGLFVSGEERQLSYASQVWLILADVVTPEEGAAILTRLRELDPDKGMVSPYMNHHYTEALLKCGLKEEALSYLKYYWGGMIERGADTFWELYNPENPEESPYGSSIVNSYCHAWSCTPAMLLRNML